MPCKVESKPDLLKSVQIAAEKWGRVAQAAGQPASNNLPYKQLLIEIGSRRGVDVTYDRQQGDDGDWRATVQVGDLHFEGEPQVRKRAAEESAAKKACEELKTEDRENQMQHKSKIPFLLEKMLGRVPVKGEHNDYWYQTDPFEQKDQWFRTRLHVAGQVFEGEPRLGKQLAEQSAAKRACEELGHLSSNSL